MQVTKRLKINAIASVTMGLIIVIMLFLALYRVNLAMEELDIAEEIVDGAFEEEVRLEKIICGPAMRGQRYNGLPSMNRSVDF